MSFPSEHARKFDALLTALGYTMERESGKHYVYVHPGQSRVTVAKTPSDWRSDRNMLAELRRRHPAAFKRQKSTREKGQGRRQNYHTVIEFAGGLGIVYTPAEAKRLLNKYGSVKAVKAAIREGRTGERVAVARYAPPYFRARRHRCGGCGRPWLKSANRPDEKCPFCGSSDVSIENSEAA